jgi:hypothetical protein
MKYMVTVSWECDQTKAVVETGMRQIARRPVGEDVGGATTIVRFSVVGENIVFSLIEAEDHQDLLREIAPIMQYAEVKVYPVLDADEGLNILYNTLV